MCGSVVELAGTRAVKHHAVSDAQPRHAVNNAVQRVIGRGHLHAPLAVSFAPKPRAGCRSLYASAVVQLLPRPIDKRRNGADKVVVVVHVACPLRLAGVPAKARQCIRPLVAEHNPINLVVPALARAGVEPVRVSHHAAPRVPRVPRLPNLPYIRPGLAHCVVQLHI